VTLITVEGSSDALSEFASLVQAPPHAELLGPVEPDVQRAPADGASGLVIQRMMLRALLSDGPTLVRAAKEAAAIRSARKSSGSLRIRVNPADLS
jgi:primosomal protein N' (replication factor Y)